MLLVQRIFCDTDERPSMDTRISSQFEDVFELRTLKFWGYVSMFGCVLVLLGTSWVMLNMCVQIENVKCTIRNIG